MSAQGKRGTGGQSGPRRQDVRIGIRLRQDLCLHSNAGVEVRDVPRGLTGITDAIVTVSCPECDKREQITDQDAGAILALLETAR